MSKALNLSPLLHLCQEKCTLTELLCLRDSGDAQWIPKTSREKPWWASHTKNPEPREKLTPKVQQIPSLRFYPALSTMAVKVTGTLRVPNFNCSQGLVTRESFTAGRLCALCLPLLLLLLCNNRDQLFLEDLPTLASPDKSRPLSLQHFLHCQRYKRLLRKEKNRVKSCDFSQTLHGSVEGYEWNTIHITLKSSLPVGTASCIPHSGNPGLILQEDPVGLPACQGSSTTGADLWQ